MKYSLQTKLKKYEKIIGGVASLLAVIVSLSLVEVLTSNIRGESRIFFQPLATAVNCFFWCLYSYGKKDWFLLIPNSVGFILGVLTAISAIV
jgi:hypothetical protein